MSIHKISLLGCGLTVFAHQIDGSHSGPPLYSANKGVAYVQVLHRRGPHFLQQIGLDAVWVWHDLWHGLAWSLTMWLSIACFSWHRTFLYTSNTHMSHLNPEIPFHHACSCIHKCLGLLPFHTCTGNARIVGAKEEWNTWKWEEMERGRERLASLSGTWQPSSLVKCQYFYIVFNIEQV